MKKMLFILAFSLAVAGAKAQLADTKWKMILNMGSGDTETTCTFSKDSLVVTITSSGEHVETLSYTLKDNILTVQKANGQSDCDTSAVGKYKVDITNTDMAFVLVSDDCSGRGEVLDKMKWVKR